MTERVIRIARSEGYEVSPRGVHQFYPQGDHKVPSEMPPEVARRCLEAGIGTEIRTRAAPPSTKKKTAVKKKRALKKA